MIIILSAVFNLFKIDKFILRIGYYASVSTDDAVLIIGGQHSVFSSIVAEYKDGRWNNIGNMARPTAGHIRAIRSGSNIMLLGGMWEDNSP